MSITEKDVILPFFSDNNIIGGTRGRALYEVERGSVCEDGSMYQWIKRASFMTVNYFDPKLVQKIRPVALYLKELSHRVALILHTERFHLYLYKPLVY